MNSATHATAFQILMGEVAACRAALRRKRGVVLRLCLRQTFGNHNGQDQLSDPLWRVWDGSKAGLAALLLEEGVDSRAAAERHRFTLAATHLAVSFEEARPASRDISAAICGLWPVHDASVVPSAGEIAAAKRQAAVEASNKAT